MTQRNDFPREAARAATWWAQRLVSDEVQDDGDPRMSAVLTRKRQERKPTTEEAARFAVVLRDMLAEKMQQRGDLFVEGFVVQSGYGPIGLLRNAAEATYISSHAFPVKTYMYIKKGKVTVRHGHGGSEQVIWSEGKEE